MNAKLCLSDLMPEETILRLASNLLPVPPMLRGILANCNDAAYANISGALELIDGESVELFKRSTNYLIVERYFPDDPNKSARLDILIELVEMEILRRRNEFLRGTFPTDRPAPYDHVALADVTVDEHSLVEMANFDTSNGVLARHSWAFDVIPTLPSLNSSHWFMNELFDPSLLATKRLRLDPFLIQPLDGYRKLEYRMRVYGRDLDWGAIARSRDQIHLRLQRDPDSWGGKGNDYTDLVWDPRVDGIHFECEELPTLESCEVRGSRYFHAIYDPQSEIFIHSDGALRYYAAEDLEQRRPVHLRHLGKVGKRVKVFQLDGAIDRNKWTALICAFFVWNDDVGNYFGAVT